MGSNTDNSTDPLSRRLRRIIPCISPRETDVEDFCEGSPSAGRRSPRLEPVSCGPRAEGQRDPGIQNPRETSLECSSDQSSEGQLSLSDVYVDDSGSSGLPKKGKYGKHSRFPGVSFHKGTRKWQAAPRRNGKNFYIGLFTTEAGAARAVYDDCIARGMQWIGEVPIAEDPQSPRKSEPIQQMSPPPHGARPMSDATVITMPIAQIPGRYSRFPGVTYHKRSQKWQATALKHACFKYLGLFATEMQAARAVYDDCVSRGMKWIGEIPVVGEGEPTIPTRKREAAAGMMHQQLCHPPNDPNDEPVSVEMDEDDEPLVSVGVRLSPRLSARGIGLRKYPGVSFHKGTRKWQAAALKPTKKAYIGLFMTETAAARAVYDEAVSRGLEWPCDHVPDAAHRENDIQPLSKRPRYSHRLQERKPEMMKHMDERMDENRRDEERIRRVKEITAAIHGGMKSVDVEDIKNEVPLRRTTRTSRCVDLVAPPGGEVTESANQEESKAARAVKDVQDLKAQLDAALDKAAYALKEQLEHAKKKIQLAAVAARVEEEEGIRLKRELDHVKGQLSSDVAEEIETVDSPLVKCAKPVEPVVEQFSLLDDGTVEVLDIPKSVVASG